MRARSKNDSCPPLNVASTPGKLWFPRLVPRWPRILWRLVAPMGHRAAVFPLPISQLHHMVIDKAPDAVGQALALLPGPLQQAARHLFGCVAHPAFLEVEGDHPQRIEILPAQQILDDRRRVGGLLVGLAIGAAERAEIVHHQVHGRGISGNQGNVVHLTHVLLAPTFLASMPGAAAAYRYWSRVASSRRCFCRALIRRHCIVPQARTRPRIATKPTSITSHSQPPPSSFIGMTFLKVAGRDHEARRRRDGSAVAPHAPRPRDLKRAVARPVPPMCATWL